VRPAAAPKKKNVREGAGAIGEGEKQEALRGTAGAEPDNRNREKGAYSRMQKQSAGLEWKTQTTGHRRKNVVQGVGILGAPKKRFFLLLFENGSVAIG